MVQLSGILGAAGPSCTTRAAERLHLWAGRAWRAAPTGAVADALAPLPG